MENQGVNQTPPLNSQNQRTNEQPSLEQTPSAPKKNNNWLVPLLSIVIFVLLASTGFFAYHYFQSTPPKKSSDTRETQTPLLPTPTITPNTSSEANTINAFTAGGFFLPIPQSWKPYLSFTEGNTIIYFASTNEDFTQYQNCIETNDCTNYFKLSISGNLAAWNNTSLEEFMQAALPDVDLDKLEKTSIDGHEAWVGSTDSKQLTYQIVIKITDENGTFIKTIDAEATSNYKSMLNDYIQASKQLEVRQATSKNVDELDQKSAYKVSISSPLVSENFELLTMALQNFLNTTNRNSSFTYILLVEGSGSYPAGDYLNQTYNLLTDNINISPGSYGTEQVQIQVEELPKNMASYFSDPNYCEQTADCKERSNFCTIGSFNKYHIFATPWGCGQPQFEGFENNQLANELQCSNIEIKHDAISCIENTCQYLNPQPVCK